jgi:hypothetical protein
MLIEPGLPDKEKGVKKMNVALPAWAKRNYKDAWPDLMQRVADLID